MLRSQFDKLTPLGQRHVAIISKQEIVDDPPVVKQNDAVAKEAADRAEYERVLARGFSNLSEAELAAARKWFKQL